MLRALHFSEYYKNKPSINQLEVGSTTTHPLLLANYKQLDVITTIFLSISTTILSSLLWKR